LPSFLNRLLEQLQAVVLEGIDYSPTQGLLEEIQRESSHLLQFAQDTGLHYDPDGFVEVNELWQRLKQWYTDTGTLIVETTILKDGKTIKEKHLWVDQVSRSDRNVKGVNQVIPRFLELFPKARKCQNRTEFKRETVIKGLAFSNKEVFSSKSGVTGVSDDKTARNGGFQSSSTFQTGVSGSQSGVIHVELDCCPRCGGANKKRRGLLKDEVGSVVAQRYQCLNCHRSWSVDLETDANSDPYDASMTPVQNMEPSHNGHSVPTDATDASLETKNFSKPENGYLKPGDTVNKKNKRGWVGEVIRLDDSAAEVLWSGDNYPTRVPISDLKTVV